MATICLCVLVLTAAPSPAQTPPISVVTFDEAIARALARNPTVARAATAITRAEALMQQARAVTLPFVGVRLTSITLDKSQGFESGTIQPQHQMHLGATASVPVLAPADWARTTQARDQIDVASDSAVEARQQVAVATAQAYLAIIGFQRQVEVETRALENAKEHLAYAQRRLEAGAGSRLNMLRAAQSASEEEARLEAARFAVRRSQEALAVLLAEDGPVDAGGEPVFEVPVTIDDAAWMDRRPDLRTQGTIVRSAERVLKDSWKDVAPYATASFDPQYVTPTGIFAPSRSWRLSISVTQPIYLGGAQRAATREREVALEAVKIDLTALQIQARSEVRLAQEAVASRERALASTRRSAEQADEVLRITTSAFEVGATTNIEVIDAQRSARDAETSVALAQFAVQQARLDLLVALGRFP
jgi:outer membrane protein TolC